MRLESADDRLLFFYFFSPPEEEATCYRSRSSGEENQKIKLEDEQDIMLFMCVNKDF